MDGKLSYLIIIYKQLIRNTKQTYYHSLLKTYQIIIGLGYIYIDNEEYGEFFC